MATGSGAFDELVEKLEGKAQKAIDTLDEGLEDALAVLLFFFHISITERRR
ncbi:MAG: hypothetical protein KAJ15_03540 [Spirochaetes bacterium]|nr:hypothetical protein [Spirochaetota bacterium]